MTRILPQHFGTTNFKSFKRQLFLYGFKSVRFTDDTQVYRHTKFRQGRFIDVVAIKRIDNRGVDVEYQTTKLELDTLSDQMQELLVEAQKLHLANAQMIAENQRFIREELERRFLLLERCKAHLVIFSIKQIYRDPEMHARTFDIIQEQEYIKPRVSQFEFENPATNSRVNEIISAHAKHVLLSPATPTGFLQQALRMALQYINKRFFHMNARDFYENALWFILRKEKKGSLASDANFHIIEQLRDVVDFGARALFADLYAPGMRRMMKKFFEDRSIELFDSESRCDTTLDEENFSVRSLSGELVLWGDQWLHMMTNFADDDF